MSRVAGCPWCTAIPCTYHREPHVGPAPTLPAFGVLAPVVLPKQSERASVLAEVRVMLQRKQGEWANSAASEAATQSLQDAINEIDEWIRATTNAMLQGSGG